ncbi:hypothetical protein [Sphingobacterium paludis]|uniref:Uncharacterized protein n=1 Tax=Sphingobacterium paludis TaxID=1476465 RepID=A0A4R7CS62_9SPHI|nr:hypothetical protein [Sphingobacterium paludis]TDS10401.1 hypothetical protein B0I21_109166 [Sphingobacterium paludis]
MENNYQLSRIHNYIHGLMSKEDMHALEREALEDPFLQDAIDGYRLQNGVDAKPLSLLQQRLERRVLAHAQRKNNYFFGWQRLTIGLVAAVMFITVCTLVLMRHLPKRGASAVTEVELMDDTLVSGVVVHPLSGADAVPLDGWDAFSAFVAEHASAASKEKRVTVLFKVDGEGKAYAIRPQVNDAATQEEIVDLLRKGPTWKGREGHIEIVYQR